MRNFAILTALLLVAPSTSRASQFDSAVDWPDVITGYGRTQEAAKLHALKQAVVKVADYCANLNPPIRDWRPDEEYVQSRLLTGQGAAGTDVKIDPAAGVVNLKDIDFTITYKTWILELRPPNQQVLNRFRAENDRALASLWAKERLLISQERLTQTSWFFAAIVILLASLVAAAYSLQWLRAYGESLYSVDSPYARWVGLPHVGFMAFSIFTITLMTMMSQGVHVGELIVSTFIAFFLAFLALHAIWFVRGLLGFVSVPHNERWTLGQITERLRRSAQILKFASFLTFAYILLVPIIMHDFPDSIAVYIPAILIAGTTMCFGARSLEHHREPGTWALIFALIPLTPAVMIGLPVALYILRMSARPEVRVFFDRTAQGEHQAQVSL